MRRIALFALAAGLAVAVVAAASVAHARLFWQTYGATVASPDGSGCVWNLNSDYFVPRTCDSCRYDLFSACKTSHSISPACKSLHPINHGYCTPYGECHYKWRDHVYKKYCCCTPLKCFHGPWKLEDCRKRGCKTCGCGRCSHAGGTVAAASPVCSAAGCGSLGGDAWHSGYGPVGAALPNVEPIGGETLGTVAAIPMSGMGGVGVQPLPMTGMPAGAAGQMMPMPAPAPAANGSMFTLPSLFGG